LSPWFPPEEVGILSKANATTVANIGLASTSIASHLQDLILDIGSATASQRVSAAIDLTITNDGAPDISLGLYQFDVYFLQGGPNHGAPGLTFTDFSDLSSIGNYLFANNSSGLVGGAASNAPGLIAIQEFADGDIVSGSTVALRA
jgi:hypothetical protein